MASIYDLAANYEMTDEMGLPMSVQQSQPAPAEAPAAAPAATAPAPAAGPLGLPVTDRNQALMGMLSKYFPQDNEYASEIKTARATLTKESEAFNKLLQDAIKQPKESGPSKAEMYFRLAAAFGAPTKTGYFTESLGAAGGAASKMLEERRASEKESRDRALQLGLEAQKLRLTGAKEDLATLRQLASEGMKDKRAIASEMIKEYVKSGQPESSAGKQAKDEGFVPGTPEFQKRVEKIAEMNVEQQMVRIQSALSGISTAQANLALNQQRLDLSKDQASKLTAPEIKLKMETEDSLSSVKGAITDLKRAFDLNKNSMGGSLVDKGSRLLLEASGSKDPTLVNTQELENILKGSMLSTAAEKMKGVLSDSDMKLLAQISGATSKNQEERRRILVNAYGALQRGMAKQQKRLNEINQGLYRETAPTGGLE